MKRVVTLGEIMLRLSTPGFQRFVQADTLEVCYGGGEANCCVSLANYGLATRFISKVPNQEIGQSAINALRRYGVDTSFMARGGERLGIYFLESGASQRPSKVIYDRAHASIAEAKKEEFDFEEIFKDADWFHFTGITPALSDEAAELTLAAVKEAKKRNITVSVDLNYRKKLWSQEKAKEVMTTLVKGDMEGFPYESQVEVFMGLREPVDR